MTSPYQVSVTDNRREQKLFLTRFKGIKNVVSYIAVGRLPLYFTTRIFYEVKKKKKRRKLKTFICLVFFFFRKKSFGGRFFLGRTCR